MIHAHSKDKIRDRPLAQRVTLSRKHDRFQPRRDVHTLRVVKRKAERIRMHVYVTIPSRLLHKL